MKYTINIIMDMEDHPSVLEMIAELDLGRFGTKIKSLYVLEGET
jgi:hypothetical protein